MRYINTGEIEEIGTSDKLKYESYIMEYVPFFRSWVAEIGNPDRAVDKAFFQFGRFLKTLGRHQGGGLKALIDAYRIGEKLKQSDKPLSDRKRALYQAHLHTIRYNEMAEELTKAQAVHSKLALEDNDSEVIEAAWEKVKRIEAGQRTEILEMSANELSDPQAFKEWKIKLREAKEKPQPGPNPKPKGGPAVPSSES